MDINELITIVKNKLLNQINIESINIEDKSFLHKNHKGNQEGKYHLKLIIVSQELKQMSKIESNKKIYKILDQELKNPEFELSNSTDPGLFKNDFEKNLYKKIHDLRKYFTSISKDENYELSLKNLAESKNTVFDFFDNVMVNDEDKAIKENRLKLLQMLRKTYENYLNFSSIESL